MIENLVAVVVTVVGLFALMGFNARTYLAESESYQRSQALILVDDMGQRIKANRANAAAYATAAANAAGGGATVACAAGSRALTDLCEWGNLLRGAAEVSAGSNVGAMADARGCISVAAPAAAASGPTSATVVVVWRGANASLTQAAAPCVPDGYTVGDGYLRYTATVVRFGDLDGV